MAGGVGPQHAGGHPGSGLKSGLKSGFAVEPVGGGMGQRVFLRERASVGAAVEGSTFSSALSNAT